MAEEKQKIGAGHAKAMVRLGPKELAQVLPAFPAQGVQPVEEPGLIGNLTPQEIAHDKGAYETMLQGYSDRAPQQHEQEHELVR